MNKEYWLIEDNMRGHTVEFLRGNMIKLIDSFRANSIKEAEKEFKRRNELNPKHQYIITESVRWLN